MPEDHIFGTRFEFERETGEIQSILRVPAGYGKVAVLDELQCQGSRHAAIPSRALTPGASRRRVLPTPSMRLAAGCAAAVIATLVPASGWAYCQKPSTGAGIKLMTYNTAMVDTPATNQDSFGMEDYTRAMKIANGILRDEPDVFVLNEVFNEQGMDEFVSQLKGKYPSYVRMVDEYGSSDSDSGLMLFSKFKFDSLTCGEANEHCWVHPGMQVEAYNEGTPWGYTSAQELATNGGDSWANKAVALLRIVNECDRDKSFAVVFTHTQASYPDNDNEEDYEDFSDRQKGMGYIQSTIVTSLSPTQLATEPVFVLGDLNVNGNEHTAEKVADGQGGTKSYTEWEYQFGSWALAHDVHGKFYACAGPEATCNFDTTKLTGPFLVDSWGYETSPDDPGQTNSGQEQGGALVFSSEYVGERVDYILHNRPRSSVTAGSSETLCMQWIARAYEVGEGPPDYLTQFSDHLPIKADFNTPFARCTPREKNAGGGPFGSEPVKWKKVGASGYTQDVVFDDANTRINFPGSMQWYKIDQKGTFSIAVDPAYDNISYEVYQSADLSRPVVYFHGETTTWTDGRVTYTGKTYKFSEPPYYVRVFPVDGNGKRDRAWTGKYRISFHQHLCKSLEDKCMLRAGELEEYEWPDTYLKPEDRLYYRFYADTLSSGDAPRIQFFIETSALSESIPVGDTGRVHIMSADATTKLGWASWWSWGDSDGDSKADTKGTAPTTVQGDPCSPAVAGCSLKKAFTLRVGRKDTYQTTKFTLGIRYETSLTYFKAKNITCAKQNTDVGDDDTWENFKFDTPNQQKSDCKGDPDCTLIGWFDEGTTLAMSVGGRFDSSVVPNLWEDEDNPGEGGHEYLQPIDVTPQNYAITYISPLSVTEYTKRVGTFHWGTWPNDIDDSAYWYELVYELFHEDETVP